MSGGFAQRKKSRRIPRTPLEYASFQWTPPDSSRNKYADLAHVTPRHSRIWVWRIPVESTGFQEFPAEHVGECTVLDGTANKQGTIWYYVDLNIDIHGITCKEQFLVTGLGHRIILGFPWLKKMNPIIDWQKGTLEWRQPELEIGLLKKKKTAQDNHDNYWRRRQGSTP